MRKSVSFFKKICALTVSAVLIAGVPVSSFATDLESPDLGAIIDELTENTEAEEETAAEETVSEDNSETEEKIEAADEAAAVSEESAAEEAVSEDNSAVEENIEATDETEVVSEESAAEEAVSEENTSEETAAEETVIGDTAAEEAIAENAAETVQEETSGNDTASETSERSSDDILSHSGSLLMLDPDPDDDVFAEGAAEGSGSMMITTVKKPKNVISMVVPILDAGSYDFVLDPDELLTLDSRNTIIGEGSTVYFRQKDAENTYSLYADIATAVNKSTVPVLLSLELNVENSTGAEINLTDLNGVYNAEIPSLCFAIVPTEFGTVEGDAPAERGMPLKSEMAMIDGEGHAAKELILPGMLDNFELMTFPTEDPNFYTQEYVVKEDVSWPTVGFTLYGACSRDTDWVDVAKGLSNGGKLSLTITYNMTPILNDADEEENNEF